MTKTTAVTAALNVRLADHVVPGSQPPPETNSHDFRRYRYFGKTSTIQINSPCPWFWSRNRRGVRRGIGHIR